MAIKCPFCSHEGLPVVSKRISMGGWVLFVVLLLVCLPLCWLPFVIDACKEEVRKCAACGCQFG
jgi:hypothetical protein